MGQVHSKLKPQGGDLLVNSRSREGEPGTLRVLYYGGPNRALFPCQKWNSKVVNFYTKVNILNVRPIISTGNGHAEEQWTGDKWVIKKGKRNDKGT